MGVTFHHRQHPARQTELSYSLSLNSNQIRTKKTNNLIYFPRQVEGAIIPAGTALSTALYVKEDGNGGGAHVELMVGTSNHTVIRMVVIFAEGIFENESHITHPPANMVSCVHLWY